MYRQNGSVFLIILVAAVLIGASAIIFLKNPNLIKQKPVACTMDAKICPDGSSVGRTAPNCEFAPCPPTQPITSPDEISDWKIYKNEKYGFEFKYPLEWNLVEKSYSNDILTLLSDDKLFTVNISAISTSNKLGDS